VVRGPLGRDAGKGSGHISGRTGEQGNGLESRRTNAHVVTQPTRAIHMTSVREEAFSSI